MIYPHQWYRPRRFAYPICRSCGMVERTDGKNGPCHGRVKMLAYPAVTPGKILPVCRDIDDMPLGIEGQRDISRGEHEAQGIGWADPVKGGFRPVKRLVVRKGAFGFYHGKSRP